MWGKVSKRMLVLKQLRSDPSFVGRLSVVLYLSFHNTLTFSRCSTSTCSCPLLTRCVIFPRYGDIWKLSVFLKKERWNYSFTSYLPLNSSACWAFPRLGVPWHTVRSCYSFSCFILADHRTWGSDTLKFTTVGNLPVCFDSDPQGPEGSLAW